MAGPLVLITGASGHLGFRTTVEALNAGYLVRVAVRNEAAMEKVKAAKSVQPYLGQLEFILVPDIKIENAYNEAVRGVDFIIHLASPITHQKSSPGPDEFDNLIIQPAIKGTLNMLKAAKAHSPTTKRIVITTSIVALIPWSEMFGETGKIFNEQSRTTLVKGPFDNIFPAYAASKVGALLVTEDFLRTEKPHFDVNHIAPSYTIGKNELARNRSDAIVGTNGSALGHVLGKNQGPSSSTSVHVNDIAKMHVLALNPKIPGGNVFLGVSENSDTHWEDSFEIVRKHFPEAVKNGTFPLSGSNPTKKLRFDTSFTKKTLGIEFLSYEEQVRSVAEHYLELQI